MDDFDFLRVKSGVKDNNVSKRRLKKPIFCERKLRKQGKYVGQQRSLHYNEAARILENIQLRAIQVKKRDRWVLLGFQAGMPSFQPSVVCWVTAF